MTPEDFDYFKSRVTRFISGSNSGIKFGSSVTPKYSRLSNIIPNRSLPQQILETIQRKTVSDGDDGIETNQRGVLALGRITLNLEQTKNNLEKIIKIISEDYKSTKEQNKKEIDDYRKRVANRGRIFGKKELGDRKVDLLGGIKKYVGSFFSGAGGAIRTLAAFNLLQAIINKDPSKIIQSLLGIGITYLPAIGGMIAGSIATSLMGKVFGGAAPAARAAVPAAAGAARAAGGASRLGKMGRLGGRAALIGTGVALASSLFNKPQEDGSQQKLEDLTQEQKQLAAPSTLVPLPQDDLRRFERLNKKFEEALDFLLKKQKEGGTTPRSGGRGGGGSPTPPPGITGITIQDSQQGLSELGITQEQFNAYKQGVADVEGARYDQMGGSGGRFAGRYQMGSGEIASAAAVMGLPNPSQQEYLSDPALQEKIYMGRTILMNRKMIQLSPEYAKMSQLERLSVLAGAQLGEGNLTDYLKGNSIADSKGVEIQRWINSAKARLAQVGSGTFTAPPAPVLPATRPAAPVLPPPPAATPQPRPIPIPIINFTPSTPNVTVLPIPVSTGPQQQTSTSSSVNDNVPVIDTTYSENFLALYSKLMYQIV